MMGACSREPVIPVAGESDVFACRGVGGYATEAGQSEKCNTTGRHAGV
jgi:hypothetical protein